MATVAQKKLDKKLRLLKSAYALFESRGVNMTAVEDVVKAAGVAKGTFYLYFKDKHDLVDQMMIAQSRSVLHEILGELRQKCEANRSTIYCFMALRVWERRRFPILLQTSWAWASNSLRAQSWISLEIWPVC